MRRQIKVIFLAACLVLHLTGCSMLKFAHPKATPSSAASALVARMPAASSAEGDKLCAELIKLGPQQIVALCQGLAPWSGKDEKVEYALSGLTTYAARPNAEAERKMVSGALINALRGSSDKEVQAFLVRLLERVGKDEAVAPLARLLKDESLCAPAAKVLQTIHTPQASAALTRALRSARTSGQRITLIQALGSMREAKATGPIMKFAESKDPAVRLEAMYALANLGVPQAEPVLARAARESAPQERAKAASYYLLFAHRQAEAGKFEDCARICRSMLQLPTTHENSQIQCAALATLAETQREKAGPDVLAAAGSDNQALRASALRLAAKSPAFGSDAQWVAQLNQAQSPAVRQDIVRMMGQRIGLEEVRSMYSSKLSTDENHTLQDELVARLKDPDAGVRLAAIEAMSISGPHPSYPALMGLLQSSTDPAELDAVKAVLLRKPVSTYRMLLVQAYPKASPQGRIRILEILGARRMTEERALCFSAAADSNSVVRMAALKAMRDLATEQDLAVGINFVLSAKTPAEATAARNVVAGMLERCEDRAAATAIIKGAYARVPGARKPALLELMPSLGGPAALQTVRKEVRGSDPATREAAIRALADWSDAAPMEDLLTLSKTSGNAKIRILAYRGYVRMIGSRQGLTNKDKVELCRKAIAAAPSREEARPVLVTLGAIPAPEAFRVAAATLEDPALREEAALAAIAVAGKIAPQIPNEVRPVMQKISTTVSNQATRRKAQGVLNTLDGKAQPARPRRSNRAAL